MSNRGKGSTALKTVPLRGATALRCTHDLRAAKGVKAVPLVLAILITVVTGGLGGQIPAYAGPPEDMPVWRVQIAFGTPDVKDAGTNDDVQVELNPSNSTLLDYG